MQFFTQFSYAVGSVSLCLMLGCVHLDNDRPPSSVGFSIPENWQTEVAPKLSSQNAKWINYFKTNKHLKSLIEQGLDSNYNLSIAHSRWLLAKAELKAISSNQLPSLNANVQGNRQRANRFTPLIEPGIFNEYGLNLGLNWEIDLWGRLNNEQQILAYNYKAAESDFKFAQISLASQIAKLWLNIMHAKGQINLSEKIIEAYELIEQSMKERYVNGLVSAKDYLSAQTTKESLYEAHLKLKKEAKVLTRSLEILLGNYPGAQELSYAPLPDLNARIPTGLPSELLLKRPDILSADQRIQSAKASVKVAQKRRFPQFSLTGAYGNSSDSLKSILDSEFTLWSVTAGITQPIINHGKLKANIEGANVRFSEAKAFYNQTVLNAFSEVENALSNEFYLYEERSSNDRQVNHALEGALISKENYKRGNEDFLSYMNALINVLNMKRENLQIKRLQLENRIDLYHALGESFIES